jgi:hypothetical protein
MLTRTLAEQNHWEKRKAFTFNNLSLSIRLIITTRGRKTRDIKSVNPLARAETSCGYARADPNVAHLPGERWRESGGYGAETAFGGLSQDLITGELQNDTLNV